MGRREDAAVHFSAAEKICRELDMPYWLEQAERGLKKDPRPENMEP
jgi:hypothetical protein